MIGDPWGTVVFYLDGRVRELKVDGSDTWDMQFYNPQQNPNTTFG
jgi:hypothetical protein